MVKEWWSWVELFLFSLIFFLKRNAALFEVEETKMVLPREVVSSKRAASWTLLLKMDGLCLTVLLLVILRRATLKDGV